MADNYILKSERLGFRNWNKNDLVAFAQINGDKEVMEYFPNPLSESETAEFIDRLIKHYETNKFNYFATELLATGELIGFVGLAYQTYETDFTPAVDIGWRLKKSAWGKGYATEGANKCLAFAFNELNLSKVISTCTAKNKKSEHLMKKIGMKKVKEFKHPRLKAFPEFETCVLYEIDKATWMERK